MSDIAKNLLWAAILCLPILPNFWCIWHAGRHAFPDPAEQTRWIRVGVFVPVLGGLLYLAFGMRRALPLPSQTGGAPVGPCNDNNGHKPETGDMS